jgi:mannose/fructose/N-acetylgalactosamine-specific phosphotransferase system component IIB
MTITLARIDDRVIHGQTTTRWTKARPVQGILVVGDDIAKDELRKKVLKAAAGNLKLGVYTVEQSKESVSKGKESKKDFFLISNSPQTFAEIVRLGIDFGKKLNVGPMNTRAGAKVLGRTVAIDEKDYEAFEYMEQQGIEIGFQLLPDDESKTWKSLKAKYDSM